MFCCVRQVDGLSVMFTLLASTNPCICSQALRSIIVRYSVLSKLLSCLLLFAGEIFMC